MEASVIPDVDHTRDKISPNQVDASGTLHRKASQLHQTNTMWSLASKNFRYTCVYSMIRKLRMTTNTKLASCSHSYEVYFLRSSDNCSFLCIHVTYYIVDRVNILSGPRTMYIIPDIGSHHSSDNYIVISSFFHPL